MAVRWVTVDSADPKLPDVVVEASFDKFVEEVSGAWRWVIQNDEEYTVQNGAGFVVAPGSTVVYTDLKGRVFFGLNALANPDANSHSRVPDFMFDTIGMRGFGRSWSLATVNDPADINYRRFGGDAPYGQGATALGTFDDLTGLGTGALVGQLRATPASRPYGGDENTPGADAVSTGAVMAYTCADAPRRVTVDGQTSNAMAWEWSSCSRWSHDFRETRMRLSSAGNLQLGAKAIDAGDQGAMLQIRAHDGVNNSQLITGTGSPTGGTFKIEYFELPASDTAYSVGYKTIALNWNATATNVRDALVTVLAAVPGNIPAVAGNALNPTLAPTVAWSSITSADLIVTGGPLPGSPITVEFTGLLGKLVQFRMRATDLALTGGTSPSVTISRIGQVGTNHEKYKRLVHLRHTTGATGEYLLVEDGAGTDVLTFDINNVLTLAGSFVVSGTGGVGYIQGTEQSSPPSAPAANGWRMYGEDNGSGKTRLMVLFNTGAAQQVAIQP